jgi:hypothetical protein
MSSSRSRPTFILIWLKPASTASRQRRRSLRRHSRASRPRSCSRDSPRFERGDALGLALRLRVRKSSASFRVMHRSDSGSRCSATISSGLISATSRQTGLPLLGQQVPDGVDHRAGRQMDRALVRADPAQLAVRGDMAPEAARVGRRIQSRSRPTTRWRSASIAAQQISLPRPMVKVSPWPSRPAFIGAEHDIGGGIIRVRVHRVRAVELLRGRKAQVDGAQAGDAPAFAKASAEAWPMHLRRGGDEGYLAAEAAITRKGRRRFPARRYSTCRTRRSRCR